jgi:hypothetical protein
MSKTSKHGPHDGIGHGSHGHVRIDIWSMVGLIDPAVPLLEPYLEYRTTRFEEGGPLGYQEREESIDIWGTDHNDRMVIPAGLVSRVQQVLTDHGYQVTLTDHREYGERFAIDKKILELTQGEDRRLLDAVRRASIGQIEVRNSRDMIATMRMVVDLYPKAHVLILVATKSVARKIRWKLDEAALGWEVELMGPSWPRTPPRCMVSTFAPMHRCETDKWDIILLPDPMATVGNRGSRAMGQWHGFNNKDVHRVYSLLLPNVRLGGRDRLRLEAISGQVIYRLGQEQAGVRVLWLPTPDSTRIDSDVTALTYKRKAYWHNNNRNDFIAAVARAFANQDVGKLGEYGVPFRGYDPLLRHFPHTKVAVLVACTEQAREMAKRLPGWRIMDAVSRNGKEETGANEGDMPGTIVTEARAGKEGLDADVVIRAGGSSGNVCFKDFPPALDKDTRAVIVVDFSAPCSTGNIDRWAIQDVNRRQREYELLGWESEPEHG